MDSSLPLAGRASPAGRRRLAGGATAHWAPLAAAGICALFIGALAKHLYSLPAYSRLFVHDEINIGMPVINAAFVFGMSYENWEFPNYLLALLNAVDGVIGGMLALATNDWRTAKLIQYGAALVVVIAGFWHAISVLLDGAEPRQNAEINAFKVLATACYALSPYALTQMNNGTFWSFSVYFAIAFVPIIVVYLLAALLRREGARVQASFGSGLVAGVCCWWLPLVAVLPLSIFLAWLLIAPGRGLPRAGAFAPARFLAGLTLGIVPVAITAYYTLVNPGVATDFRSMAHATYGNIQGGVLTPLLQRFSWILYVGWGDKAVHAFFAGFDSLSMRFVYLAGVGIVALAAMKARDRGPHWRFLVALMLVFMSAVFFAKGSSYPFGKLFVAFIDMVPGGGVIRTPDTKFGMVATAALLLAWGAAAAISTFARRAVAVLGVLYLASAVPLFLSGDLINPPGPARYFVMLSSDEQKALEILNRPGHGRALMFPGSGSGVYPFDGYSYVGRNYLTTNVNRPMVSMQAGIVGEHASLEAARGFLARMDLPSLKEMGIRYVLMNKLKEPLPYRAFLAHSDDAAMKTLIDGQRVALFELLGENRPFAATDAGGREVRATIARSPILPLGFVITLRGASATQVTVRADTVASAHWRWLPLSGNSARWAVSPVALSRVGLAQWTLQLESRGQAGQEEARWVVVHLPNLFLALAMLSALLAGLLVCGVNAWRIIDRSWHPRDDTAADKAVRSP